MITEVSTAGILGIQGLSPEHLERRKKFVTASEIPAILGLDSYRGPVDVWLEKTGRAAPRESSEPAAIGTALESGVKTLVEAATKLSLSRSGAWCVHDGFMGATLDWRASDPETKRVVGIVQAKTTGMVDEWITEPPARVIVQVHAEMICSEEEVAYIAALLGGHGPLKFRMFRVDRDAELCTGIIERARQFYECLTEDRMPAGVARLETLKRVGRESGKRITVADDLMQDQIEAMELVKVCEKQLDQMKQDRDAARAAIIQQDPTAEVYESSVGSLVRTSVNVKSYTVDARTDERITFKAPKGV